MEPADELAAGLFYYRPESEAGETLVIGHERGQELVLDLLSRRGPAAIDVPHDFGVAIQRYEVVYVIACEAPQDQPLRLQKDVH